MKHYVAVSFIAATLTSSAVALATVANPAPSGPSTLDQTVRTLEASGYHVIVNRMGGAALSQCTVSAVRPGQTHSTEDSRCQLHRHDDHLEDRLCRCHLLSARAHSR